MKHTIIFFCEVVQLVGLTGEESTSGLSVIRGKDGGARKSRLFGEMGEVTV